MQLKSEKEYLFQTLDDGIKITIRGKIKSKKLFFR